MNNQTPMPNSPPKKPVVIQFFAAVIEPSINALLATFNQKMRQGATDFLLLISSPGGSVFHGLSAYNYLRGLPINLTTHNFGSVDSIGVVLYCAGARRLSVPQARFLMHAVSANFPQSTQLEEPQLEEKLKALQIDIENIAKVVAANTKTTVQQATQAMLDRTTLSPEQAQNEWGLVHEIRSQLFEPDSEVIHIFQQTQQPPPARQTADSDPQPPQQTKP